MGGSWLKQIVILTGNELRHRYFRKRIALKSGIKVSKTYCESEEDLIQKVRNKLQQQKENSIYYQESKVREIFLKFL